MRCYNCGKTIIFGRSHTHHRGVAGGRWKKRAPKTQRIFEPNLVRVNIIEKGVMKRVTLCSKCLKRINKDMADGKKPFLTLATSIKKEVKPLKQTTVSKAEMQVKVPEPVVKKKKTV